MAGSRRWGMGRLLPLLALVLLPLTACGGTPADDPPDDRPSASSAVAWQRLPDLPLSERSGPVVAWTGTEVLAIGGDIGVECPPNASCVRSESARDGVALDLATRTWRRVADAPRDVPAYSSSAVVRGRLYLLVDRHVLVYDARADAWETLPRRLDEWYQLVADGARLVLLSGSDEQGVRPDLALDPVTGRWSQLPDDPLGPSFNRTVVRTDHGLLLGAQDLVDNPGADGPSYVQAALLDEDTGKWRELAPGEQMGAPIWAPIGDHVVGLSLETGDGGGPEPGDYGREVPFGGLLDLRSGAWSAFADPPRDGSGGWGVLAAGERWVAGSGYLYDDAAVRWERLPRPEGAAENPGPAVWAGDTLVVVTASRHYDAETGSRSHEAWTAEVR